VIVTVIACVRARVCARVYLCVCVCVRARAFRVVGSKRGVEEGVEEGEGEDERDVYKNLNSTRTRNGKGSTT